MRRREWMMGLAAGLGLRAAGEEWPSPVLDFHLHPRRTAGECLAHVEGAGMSKAVLLTPLRAEAVARAEVSARPDRFWWFLAGNAEEPGVLETLRKALESGGAKGIGEMKNHTAADAKAMRRIYDLCAEHKAPVLIHFQEVAHFAGEGDWNTGFQQFDRVLKAHPKTTFVGHADFFWANISAGAGREAAYPAGKVTPGGLTDRWLGEYPNLYGDLSANSGNNALGRDPEFAREFLRRHVGKLVFGSDCSCRDGKGTGGSPLLPRLKGKCVGRDTLERLAGLMTAADFRRVAWENGHRLLGVQG